MHFVVKDSGIGIRKSDMQRLFHRFERLDEGRNRRIEGTGLGLSITQQLLGMMGSHLNVESEYGVGSVFSFDLEQRIIDEASIGNFEKKISEESKNYHYHAWVYAPEARILVVDDNAMNRKVVTALLKETAVQIGQADCGRSCLELVRKEQFDLILLDHMMPDMDGFDTLRRIREQKDGLCRETPVIAFTANCLSGAKERYEQKGFAGVLSKPVIPEELEDALLRYLPKELLLDQKMPAEQQIQIQERDMRKRQNCHMCMVWIGHMRGFISRMRSF